MIVKDDIRGKKEKLKGNGVLFLYCFEIGMYHGTVISY